MGSLLSSIMQADYKKSFTHNDYNKIQLQSNYGKDSSKSIIFIQDYVYKAFEDRNISLANIDNFVETYQNTFAIHEEGNNNIKINNSNNTYTNSYLDEITNRISKLDLADFIKLNRLINSYLATGVATINIQHMNLTSYKYDNFFAACENVVSVNSDMNDYKSLLQLFDNPDVSDSDIMMNKVTTYRLVPVNQTLFVIVYSGFSNILINGRLETRLRRYFVKSLTRGLFNLSNLEEVMSHPLFDVFLTQVMLNTK